jgi:hypothetical protein
MLRRLCLIDNVLFLPLFLNQSYHSSKGGNSSQCWVIARSMYTTLLLYHDESCFESQLPFKQLEWWTPLTLVIWSQFLNESCFESQKKNMMGLNGAFLIENGDLAASGLSFQPNICYVVKRIMTEQSKWWYICRPLHSYITNPLLSSFVSSVPISLLYVGPSWCLLKSKSCIHLKYFLIFVMFVMSEKWDMNPISWIWELATWTRTCINYRVFPWFKAGIYYIIKTQVKSATCQLHVN